MPVLELETFLAAPVERAFDLARSIDMHVDSTAATGERAVAGVTSGLIGLGEEVTWRARHLGVWQLLTVRITGFDRPHHFTDTMLRGAFRSMEHDHHFAPAPGGTVMRDVFTYRSPLGPLGRLADILFLERYVRSFLTKRNQTIKAAAESEAWRRYLREG